MKSLGKPYRSLIARIALAFMVSLFTAHFVALAEKVPLFDGSGLGAFVAEWKVEDPENELRDSIWSIREGVLHGKGGVYGWLRSKEKYGDFLIHAEYKLLAENSNTGISIRCDPYTPSGRMNPSRTGYEVQLIHGDERLHDLGPFSLYRYVAPTVYSANPILEWHTVEIRCQGPVIQVVHNGDLVLDFDQSMHPTLKDVPLSGYVGLQTHGGGEVEFRNVWIEKLSEELPPPPTNPFAGLNVHFRELLDLRDGWKCRMDPGENGTTEGWEDPEWEDSDWERIQAGETVKGSSWYRRRFDLGPIPRNADVFLYFASASGPSRVSVNGREVGVYNPEREGLNQRFGFRVHRYLDEGSNTIAVFVEGGEVRLGNAVLLIEQDP